MGPVQIYRPKDYADDYTSAIMVTWCVIAIDFSQRGQVVT